MNNAMTGGIAQPPPNDIYELAAYPWQISLLGLAAGVAIATLAGLAWWWWQRRKRREEPVPTVNLLDVAFNKLCEMAPPTPFTAQVWPNYYYELGLLFREIVERTCGFPATDLTLSEIKAPLTQHLGPENRLTVGILQFLTRAEMIKFAEAPTTLEEARTWQDELRGFARELRSSRVTPAGGGAPH